MNTKLKDMLAGTNNIYRQVVSHVYWRIHEQVGSEDLVKVSGQVHEQVRKQIRLQVKWRVYDTIIRTVKSEYEED